MYIPHPKIRKKMRKIYSTNKPIQVQYKDSNEKLQCKSKENIYRTTVGSEQTLKNKTEFEKRQLDIIRQKDI